MANQCKQGIDVLLNTRLMSFTAITRAFVQSTGVLLTTVVLSFSTALRPSHVVYISHIMSEDITPDDRLVSRMIDKISKDNTVFFKSLQKDENDLNLDQKRTIVKNLFQDKKDLFLQRYGSLLTNEELNYFADGNEDNLDIQTIVNNLRDNLIRNSSKAVVKNRRYQALQELMRSGDYFSDCQMRSRNPLLFEQMIGQYMTAEEKTKLTNDKYSQDHDRVTFSSFLMEQIDKNYMDDLMKAQKSAEEVEEFDTDSDDDEKEYVNEELCVSMLTNEPKEKLDETQKQELREEFKRLMAERFLQGKDKEFYDYSECDNNMDLDLNQIYEKDIEERYFDQD